MQHQFCPGASSLLAEITTFLDNPMSGRSPQEGQVVIRPTLPETCDHDVTRAFPEND